MSLIAIDTETALFRPGMMAPELACVTWATDEGTGIFHWKDPELLPWLKFVFTNNPVVGHNTAYDTAVLCANFPSLTRTIFKAYNERRITDTLLREQLLRIAEGTHRGEVAPDGVWRKPTFDLGSVARRYGMPEMDKDVWRRQYGQLRDKPLAEWPTGAIEYAILDAKVTLDIYRRQGEAAIPDEYDEAIAFFALQLASIWGLRTSKQGVLALKQQTAKALDEVRELLIRESLVREDGTRNIKAAQERIAKAWLTIGEDEPPRTKKGAYQLDADACTDCEDPVMEAYSDYTTLGKVLNTDCELLMQGVHMPIHTGYKMVETTRTASRAQKAPNGTFGGNVQNIRRLPGVRECFIPRPDHVFVEVDYPTLELRTLAEVQYAWFGESLVGDALRAGIDPHMIMGCAIYNEKYGTNLTRAQFEELYKTDDNAKACRQLAKVANYGLPGGLGWESFIAFAWTGSDKTIKLNEQEARDLIRIWKKQWADMPRYFARVKSLKDPETKLYMVEHIYSGIVRGCSSFTKAANSPFQSLGASCAKKGLWYVTEACYLDKGSPLFGARPVNMVHDSVIVEMPLKWGIDRLNVAAHLQAKLFDMGAQFYLKKVPIKSEPIMMFQWSKMAKPVHDDKGRLVPWQNATHQ